MITAQPCWSLGLKCASRGVDAYFVSEGCFTHALCAYDKKYSVYKPGTICLENLIEVAFEMGCDEYNLSAGDFSYKFEYCDQIRLIGPSGEACKSSQFICYLRELLVQELRKIPFLYDPIKRYKNRIKERKGDQFVFGY